MELTNNNHMTDLVLTFLFGVLIAVRCFSRDAQIVVGLILVVLALLGYGVGHFIR